MGEDKATSLESDFKRSVKIEFYYQLITPNAGVLLLREADSQLNLTNSIAKGLIDTRDQAAIRYQLGDILREHIYAMAIGYSAQDNVDRPAHDIAFRIAVWNLSFGISPLRLLTNEYATQPLTSTTFLMKSMESNNAAVTTAAIEPQPIVH